MKRSLRKLMLLFLLALVFLFLRLTVTAQEHRSYDGRGNNRTYPEWGAAGTNQIRIIANGFNDQISQPAGDDRPNPRVISNEIFNQGGLLSDARLLSDYAWVWGQFIDHDITLVPDHSVESINIAVPSGDRYFDPFSTGTVIIPMNRSAYDPASGTDVLHPRAFPNEITAFIDGSAVYGSDSQRAKWLRTFKDGKLKTSTGEMLPFNTYDGNYSLLLDITAPEMAMPFPRTFIYFVAGDVRANENPLLSTIHTLFVREHNRLCDIYRVTNPGWSDEQLYQKARRIVGALIQSVTYEQWLPTLGVHLEPYSGYDPAVNPGIMNVFSAAAYRYGHTVINSKLLRLDQDGKSIPQGDILLRDAFFNPTIITKSGGLEPFFRGAAVQVEQDFDMKLVDDLRNFLFGAPGAGGLDLASININRGRERGLPDYNTVRKDIGLPQVRSFSSLTSNPWMNEALEKVYGDISRLDPWVGFLSEDHMPDALFGQSVMTIVSMQFRALRDGDRFYYENDPDLTPVEKMEIKNTALADILMRNTDLEYMQDNVFLAQQLSTSIVDRNAESIELKVYPNPASHLFYTEVPVMENTDGEIRIFDYLGRAVYSRELTLYPGIHKLEWRRGSEMTPGIYQVFCRVGNKVGTQNLVVAQ